MKKQTNKERHFGGIFKTPGRSPQTKLLIYTTSSEPSKKSLLKRTKKKQNKNKKNIHYNNRGDKKQKTKMADLKKFTTTLIQLHFSSHKNRFLSRKKIKRKTAMLLADGGTLTGTAKLVLDINIQKNDAR